MPPLKNLMKTFSAKAEDVNRQWWIIDAKDQVLGQVAVAAANLIRGKTRPTFTPHVDTGDFVVVINADKVVFTGKKEQQKLYTSKRGGFIGNQKVETVEKVRQRRPELLVHRAVKGMVPHNRLGNAIVTKLKVYAGAEHPHVAQNPKPFAVA
jgi:large subunit ribosomal protein L13